MLNYIFIIISAAIFLAVIRMLKGPTAADRIVALDTITTIISSLLVILALFLKNNIYLDISFVFAALSFTGVVVIARYLEGRA